MSSFSFFLEISKSQTPSSNRDPALIKHRLLHPDEMPTPGTLVSIDAEFVLMQQVRK